MIGRRIIIFLLITWAGYCLGGLLGCSNSEEKATDITELVSGTQVELIYYKTIKTNGHKVYYTNEIEIFMYELDGRRFLTTYKYNSSGTCISTIELYNWDKGIRK